MTVDAQPIDATLAALADPVRRRTVELLGDRPCRSGELAAAVGVTPATMSKHLRVLRSSGLVTHANVEFDTRVRVYSLASAPMIGLRRWLADTEQAWSDELAAFGEHLAASSEGGAAPERDVGS